MNCGACRWFAADPAARGVTARGQCRAAPPAVMMAPVRTLGGDTIQPVSVWPAVEGSSWCARYEEAEPCGR